MSEARRARLILATEIGASIDTDTLRSLDIPDGVEVLTADRLGIGPFLAAPFEEIPILPAAADYRGQPIGAILGPDWLTLDRFDPLVPQGVDDPSNRASTIDTDTYSVEPAGKDGTDTAEIVEGIYRTGLQLHMSDAPLWVEATPSGKGVHLTLPCQWPAHVRNSVAVALSLPVRAIHLACTPPSGNRDAAVVVPAILAVIAAAIAYRRGEPLRLALRHDQSFLTGGRAPAVTQWASGLDEGGRVLTNTIRITLNHGAYPILNDETKERLRVAATSIYDPGGIDHTSVLTSTRDVPMSGFEGIGSAQLSFAREVHWNRLAEIAGQDPILWRRRHLRKEWPVVAEICGTLAAEADFHRRYSANELIRKRRVQLPRDSAALRGIGFALSDQQSGFTEARENGAVTVGLNQDGTAHLYCSVPTPTERLKTAWQQIVAQELGIERDAVILDTSFDSNQHDSGPRLFSRGVTLVPRAIISACQALQKQRFREPLPITVRRTLRGGRGTRTPVDALRSIGATAVEAILRPASMEIDIRSVTMVIYAGRVIDRAMAEAELRRGIYHALNWTLHESLLDAELVTEKETLQTYNTAFRGAVPKIRIVFVNQIRRDGPVGISELPFNTVPAALVSALSQATGLYLDSLPVQPAQILRLLQED